MDRAPPGYRPCLSEQDDQSVTGRVVADREAGRSAVAVEVIVMGTADLSRALRLPSDPQRLGLLPALAHCVLAARARGVDILDGIFAAFRDPSGFREACLQGKALGFDGKTLIHPDQIASANELFGVSAEEATEAPRVLAAWGAAAGAGRGIAVCDGRIFERLHVEESRRVLAFSTQPSAAADRTPGIKQER